MHLSEMISEIVEPVVDEYKYGFEAISTEDMLARFVDMDQKYEGWSPTSWWDGKADNSGRYEGCGTCIGEDGYVFDEKNPELCKCEDSPPALADGSEGCEYYQVLSRL